MIELLHALVQRLPLLQARAASAALLNRLASEHEDMPSFSAELRNLASSDRCA